MTVAAGGLAEDADGAAVPSPRVRVRGRLASPYELDDLALVGLADERLTCRYLCASGRRWGGRWRGVPLSAVTDRAGVDPAATHVVARGGGGHAACVPVVDALDGVLAVERNGTPLAPDRCPRLVVPGVDAARAVKGVRELDFRRLAPDEDPTDHERLGFDGFPADGNGTHASNEPAANEWTR